MTPMPLFGLHWVRIHLPNQSLTILKLYIQLYHSCIPFTEIEWRKVFAELNDDRKSNEKKYEQSAQFSWTVLIYLV